MKKPTREEAAAQWLWGYEYASQLLSLVEWCKGLPEYKKRTVRQMLRELDAASKVGTKKEKR